MSTFASTNRGAPSPLGEGEDFGNEGRSGERRTTKRRREEKGRIDRSQKMSIQTISVLT